jgi:hypothetical protein
MGQFKEVGVGFNTPHMQTLPVKYVSAEEFRTAPGLILKILHSKGSNLIFVFT